MVIILLIYHKHTQDHINLTPKEIMNVIDNQ